MSRRDDVVIIGAGPNGLAVSLHLLALAPSLEGHITVLDPSGGWLRTWRDLFTRLDITTLRSPGVHHPSPEPQGLTRFVKDHGAPTSGLSYGVPRADVFDRFCHHLADAAGLTDAVRPWKVRTLEPDGPSIRVITDYETLEANHVVVASNPHRRVVPGWARQLLATCAGHPSPASYLRHANDVDLRSHDLAGEVVCVIGGGLTAAHLAVGAIERGARVELVSRRPLRSRMFDVDAWWLGPRDLERFTNEENLAVRLYAARSARGGGSVPPWMFAKLAAHQRTGQLCIREGTTVTHVSPGPGGPTLTLSSGVSLHADHIWLGTGTDPRIDAFEPLEHLLDDIPSLEGFPIIGPDLRLGSLPISVTGRLATLELGPAAGNLWGARQAAARIARDITGVEVAPEAPTP